MTTPNEIGGRQLRLVRILWIASFALLAACVILFGIVFTSTDSADFLLAPIGITFALLTAALIVAPAIAFLLYTRRPDAAVTPKLRSSAMISALVPLTLGVFGVTANETTFVALGVVLIALAAAVVVRLAMTPRTETMANPPVLRSGMAVLGFLVAMLASIMMPHGHSRAQSYRTAMRSDLRNLVTAQELFFDSTKRYDTSLAALDFRASRDVHPPRITVVQSGWSATNTHSKMPGLSCAIAVKMANPLVDSARDGEPACVEGAAKRR